MTVKKRLLILGAGRGQVGLIKAAKEMGITTVVGTLPGDNLPGLEYADEVINMDISNPDDVVLKSSSLNLDGVATSCLDTGVTALGKANDYFNFTGLTENAAILCQDKLKMKKALIKSGVSTPNFYKISSKEQLSEALKKLDLPVIIKATDLQGSKGIYIAETEQDAYFGFEKAMNDTKRDYCIIEEFIDGIEFGVQSFVYNGEVLFIMPHGDKTFMSHTAVPVGHFVPYQGDEKLLRQTKTCVEDAIHALGLDNCAVNVDLILKDGKVYIIELTGRVGANGLPELVSIYYGINYYKMIATMAIGGDPREVWNTRDKFPNAGLVEMLFSDRESGIIKRLEYSGLIDKDIYEITFFKKPGDEVRVFESSNDCIGQIVVRGKELHDCQLKMNDVKSQITFELY